MGGENILERTSKAGLMAQDRVEEFTARARELVASGRGPELMLMPGWWYAISAESYPDRLTETPDGLAPAPTIKCPTLYGRRGKESRENYPAEDSRARAGRPCDVGIAPQCARFSAG